MDKKALFQQRVKLRKPSIEISQNKELQKIRNVTGLEVPLWYVPNFDKAIVGTLNDFQIVYSQKKMIAICLTNLKMSEDDAYQLIICEEFELANTHSQEVRELLQLEAIQELRKSVLESGLKHFDSINHDFSPLFVCDMY